MYAWYLCPFNLKTSSRARGVCMLWLFERAAFGCLDNHKGVLTGIWIIKIRAHKQRNERKEKKRKNRYGAIDGMGQNSVEADRPSTSFLQVVRGRPLVSKKSAPFIKSGQAPLLRSVLASLCGCFYGERIRIVRLACPCLSPPIAPRCSSGVLPSTTTWPLPRI